MQQQQEELDEVVDVFQEAQAISDEINYQQDQINDIINQNTDQITGMLLFRMCYALEAESIYFTRYPFSLS
jgi:hypothetical protein